MAIIGFEFESFCVNSYIPVTALKYDTDKISENACSVLKKLIDSNNSLKMVQKTLSQN